MSVVQDLQFGVRMLRKSPAFTAAAVLALGLGVGANTTVFTWLKSVLLEPLPGVAHGESLATLSSARVDAGGYSTRYSDFRFYRDHSRSFGDMTAYELMPVNLAREGRPQIVLAGIVTPNYAEVLGVRPFLGRWFRADEWQGIGAHPVAVLSYPLWRGRFGGDPGVVGRTVALDSRPYTVVGVAPADFLGSYGGIAQELWVPITQEPQLVPGGDLITKGTYPVQITARLRPGIALSAANAELLVLSRRIGEAEPAKATWHEVAYPLSQAQRGLTSSLVAPVEVLMAVVGVILVISCLNVANLLLARALVRRREIAIRLSLGARRGRLLRQLMTEGILLALMGELAGLAFAAAAARTLPALLPAIDVPMGFNLGLDVRVLLFSGAITGAAVLLFCLVPALQTAKADAVSAVKEGGAAAGGQGGHRRHGRLRQALVVAQLALSLTILAAAGLVSKSLVQSMTRPPGFATDHLLLSTLDAFLGGYSPERGAELYRQLTQQIATLPGVKAASFTSYAPLGLSGGGNSGPVTVPGYVPPRNGEAPTVVIDQVGPDYLRTMGIGLTAGRDIDAGDRAGAASVVVVNDNFAHEFFGKGNALGRHITVRGVVREVVGVMHDYKYRNLDEDPSPMIVVPFLQDYRSQMTIVVRTAGEPLALLPAVTRTVATLAPGLAATQVMSGEQRLSGSLFTQRIATKLLGALGLLAVLLAAIGLFGVMSYFVSQRPREIGIRMALGAGRRQVLGMVLGQGLRLSLIGIVLGLLASAACGRLLASVLYRVSPFDPFVLIGVAALLATVTLFACWLPARRAAGMEPFVALRQET